MNKNRFSRFEERIQALVEGGFARLFAGRLHAHEVALRLGRAMEDGSYEAGDTLVAPNYYQVRVHPGDHAAITQTQPTLTAALADHLATLAADAGLHMVGRPQVELVADADIPAHGVTVIAEHVDATWEPTRAMTAVNKTAPGVMPEAPPALPPAFLLVDGTQYLALDRSVVNIGRRRDNTVVIDDPRVSRQHVQLRCRFGQFVLFDLGSSGGTFVNDERVSECVLKPGDVISLAGVKMMYVEDETGSTRSSKAGDTQVRFSRIDPDEDDFGGR